MMSVLGKRQHDDNHNVNDDNKIEPPPYKKAKSSEIIKQDNDVDRLDLNSAIVNERTSESIVLNVGGTKYETTIQTLTGYNSMLKARFSSKYTMKPSKDGSYFLDRNGKLFEHILEYLRNGQLLLPQTWNNCDIYKFYIEVKYYMIESLFQPILLKLFNSEILTNDILKMKIVNKINKDINKTIEHLNEWKLIYKYNECSANNITRNQIIFESLADYKKTLLLIEAGYQVFGMFLSMYPKNNKWFYEYNKSFAFRCGPNSSHLCSNCNDENIDITFDKVRRATEDEIKSNKDDNTTSLRRLHPVLIYGYDEDFQSIYGDFILKYMKNSRNDTNDVYVESEVSKMEFWLIPTI